ncbi:MAG: alpha/beta fold hydrolase [Phycisphaerae bacterium]|nr:alpha/beta fold hydrolase [Phycisphaerae bacterium]
MKRSRLIRPLVAALAALLAVQTALAEDPKPAASAPAADPVGIWEGALEVGPTKLRIVFHIRRDGDALSATMDSPDQGAKGLPVKSVTFEDPKLTLDVAVAQGQFVGERDAAFGELKGEWSQRGHSLPLTLKRVAAPTERKRPQVPQPPFPYRSEEVTYEHASKKFKLAGTLTLPEGAGPFAAAILISGSGAQDRDETIFDHKPFLVLADHLSRAGVAVLRVDDRGVGGTGHDGNPKDDTSADYATDVSSAIAYLKTRSEIDAKRIGLVGHSEGGLIAPLVAAEDASVAFAVLLAGPGVPGDELLYLQGEKLWKAGGADEATLARNRRMQREIFGFIKNEPDPAKGREAARAFLRAEHAKLSDADKKEAGDVDAFAEQHSAVIEIPWFRYFLSADPRPVLQRVKCPVLAITGEVDLQVPPEQNLPEIEKALKAGGNKDVTTLTMPSMNHLLQTAKTGAVTEYGDIEETMAPAALDAISAWLKARGFAKP